jgi:hypothetical protein
MYMDLAEKSEGKLRTPPISFFPFCEKISSQTSEALSIQNFNSVQKHNFVCSEYIAVRFCSSLKEAQYLTSGAGLKLLANHRKMQLLRRLMSALGTIKTLHETDYHLRDLLQVQY